jgi:hypothetical protein
MKIQELLNEVNMSPTTLKNFIDSPFTENIKIGFEFEIIVPGLEDINDHNSGNDMTKNENFPNTDDWKEKAYNWLKGGTNHSSLSWIKKQLDNFEDQFNLWQKTEASDYMADSKTVNKIKREILKLRGKNTSKEIIDNDIINGNSEFYKNTYTKIEQLYVSSKLTFKDFLNYKGIDTYMDFCIFQALKYPYLIKYKHSLTLPNLTKNFKQYTDYHAVFSKGYHIAKREPHLWIFEPDGSVMDLNKKGAGIELVSPPMYLKQGLQALDKVYSWAKENNITTNNTTGMHVGISLPNHKKTEIDYLKLILFLGDRHILNTFNRNNNTFCNAITDKLDTKFKYLGDMDKLLEIIKNGVNKIAKNSYINNLVDTDDRCVTVNIKPNYIEFRSAGGNYLENKDLVMNTIARYIKAISIASDLESEKNEYIKKLYKFLQPNLIGNSDSTDIFVKYAAGLISKKQMKQILKNLSKMRKTKVGNVNEVT